MAQTISGAVLLTVAITSSPDQLDHRHADVAAACVQTQRPALQPLRVERVDVGHRRCEVSTAQARERRDDHEGGVGRVGPLHHPQRQQRRYQEQQRADDRPVASAEFGRRDGVRDAHGGTDQRGQCHQVELSCGVDVVGRLRHEQHHHRPDRTRSRSPRARRRSTRSGCVWRSSRRRHPTHRRLRRPSARYCGLGSKSSRPLGSREPIPHRLPGRVRNVNTRSLRPCGRVREGRNAAETIRDPGHVSLPSGLTASTGFWHSSSSCWETLPSSSLPTGLRCRMPITRSSASSRSIVLSSSSAASTPTGWVSSNSTPQFGQVLLDVVHLAGLREPGVDVGVTRGRVDDQQRGAAQFRLGDAVLQSGPTERVRAVSHDDLMTAPPSPAGPGRPRRSGASPRCGASA